ncbi:bacterial alpha-L-rhamnosidase-domain-containing protein [Pelagophyceae sp. CCMP2097]|nr:bacterial alpha-L-rhamnosidase-domain-containing protein [Pelagophyceae sp. CCMP2097]
MAGLLRRLAVVGGATLAPLTEPYALLHGGRWLRREGSVDPFRWYVWDYEALDRSGERYAYQILYDAPVRIDALNGGWVLEFSQNAASWIEVRLNATADVNASARNRVSEHKYSVLATQRPLRAYAGGWFRLEPNALLYEGVRFAFIQAPADGSRIDLVEARRAVQVVPVNYAGSFECDDAFLTKLWAIGAYTTRAALVSTGPAAFLGSILVDRGDRIAFFGDAYVAQATAIVSFDARLLAASLNLTSRSSTDIEPYKLMWVLTLCDHFEAYGDVETLNLLADHAEGFLRDARDRVAPQARNGTASLRWSRDDSRLGYGFEFPDIPRAQCAYRALFIEASRRFGAARVDADWSVVASGATAWELQNASWSTCGLHAFADFVNAGVYDAAPESVQRAGVYRWFTDDVELASLSAFESYFVLRALYTVGLASAAHRLIQRQWGAMLESGATTVWERFDPDFADAGALEPNGPPPNSMGDRTSMAHPWASGATALLSKFVIGVKPTTPGFTTFSYAPIATDHPKWVRGAVPTPHGPVFVTARQQRGVLFSTLAVPEATVAALDLEAYAARPLDVTGLMPAGVYDICIVDRAARDAPPTESFHKPRVPFIDRTTRGSWRGVYGSRGYVLFNYTAAGDVSLLPPSVSAVWASSKVDARGGAPAAVRAACGTQPGRGGTCVRTFADAASPEAVPEAPPPATDARGDVAPVGIAAALFPLGWEGSFHVDVIITAPTRVTLYFADYASSNASLVTKTRDLDTLETVAPAVFVSAFAKGVHVSFRSNESRRFRFHQLIHQNDRAAQPSLAALFFD